MQDTSAHALIVGTDTTFDEIVIQSPIPVVVDFWAPWCGPCRSISLILEVLSVEYEGRLRVVKVNVDENEKRFTSFGLSGIPALLFFNDGQLVETQLGASSYVQLKELFDRVLAASGMPCPEGEPSQAERDYTTSVTAADEEFHTALEPIEEDFNAATKDEWATYWTGKQEADGRFDRGEISSDEHQHILDELEDALVASTAPATERYKAARIAAEAVRDAKLAEAMRVFHATRGRGPTSGPDTTGTWKLTQVGLTSLGIILLLLTVALLLGATIFLWIVGLKFLIKFMVALGVALIALGGAFSLVVLSLLDARS